MEVTFSEGGRYKFACYRLTYEESKSPDRIAKIKANLASKGKDGYSIAITYDASPTPPTWDTFANSLLCLDRRLEMWKLMQESWLHHKAVEAQKGVSKMSTSYFIFTEVLANDQWHCINPQVMKLLPIEQGKTGMQLETFVKVAEALQVSADYLLRPDVPEVKAIYQGEFAELLEDCSASEMETILKIVREVKASMHKKQNND